MRRQRATIAVLAGLVTLSGAMLPLTRARAGAPAGVYITNNAGASFATPGGAGTAVSNPVTTVVLAAYRVRLSPPGTVAAPAFDLAGAAGDTLVCRFTLDNLANAPDSFAVASTILAPNTLVPAGVIVFLDSDANGRFDAGEDDPTFLSLAAETSTLLDIGVVLPANGSGSCHVEIRAVSIRGPGTTDATVLRVSSQAAPPLLHFGPAGNPRALPGGEGSADDRTVAALGPLDEIVAVAGDVENAGNADSVTVVLANPAALPPGVTLACTDTTGTPFPAAGASTGFNLGAFAPGETRRVRVVFSSPGTPLRTALGAANTFSLAARSVADSLVSNATVFELLQPVLPDPRAVIGLDQTFHEATASAGDVVSLVVTVTNRTDSIRVDGVHVFESAPATLDFLGGAGFVPSGAVLRWDAGTLAPGQAKTTVLKFAVNSREPNGWARASAVAAGSAETGDDVDAGPVVAAVRIDNEEIGVEGFILGDVWIDDNADGRRDAGERGVPGASLYLESGEHVVTDSSGVFSIPHVFEGRRIIRLDERSLPPNIVFPEPLAAEVETPRGNERLVHLIAPGHARVAFPLRELPPPPVARSVVLSAAEKVSVARRAWLYDKLTLSSAQFAVGKATLLPGSENELTPTVSFLLDNPGWMVLVEGHTDAVPIHTRQFPSNRELSEARAGAVRDALVRFGVSAHRVVVVGYGDTRPVAGNTTVEGRRLNRRVEVSYIPPGPEDAGIERQVASAIRDLSTVPDSVRATLFWSFSTTAERPQRGSLRIDVPGAFVGTSVTVTMRGETLAREGGGYAFDSFVRGAPIDCRVSFTAAAADTVKIRDLEATIAVADSASAITLRGSEAPTAGQPARSASIRPLSNPASAVRTTSADILGWTELTDAPAPVDTARSTADVTDSGPPGLLRIIEPADGAIVSSRDQVSVRARHLLGSRVTLAVNGDEIAGDRVGQRTVDVANESETTTWYGVRLRPGWNDLVVRSRLLDGGAASDTARVALASRPTEIVPLDARLVAPADGRSPSTLRFSVRDAFGLPVMDGFVLTVTDGADWISAPDARPGERGVQVATREGIASVAVRPRHETGTGLVAVEANGMRAETEVVFVAPERPFLATGVIDVALGAHDAGGDGSGHGVESYHDGLDVTAESRLLVQGAAPGGVSVTARLDTKKRYDDPLLKQPDPERQYPAFGDASLLHYGAPARGGNYVSFDRGQSYLRYSDFRTPIDRGEFLTYHQTVTGLSGAFVDGPNSARAFVTKTDFVTRTDDIPADGTSGFYYLSQAPIVENSERVIVEVRDRFQPEKVLDARVMMRRRDYIINPYDGSILFMEPVAVTDRDLNPRHVVVTYQTESAGEGIVLFGMRADAMRGERYRAGVTAVANAGDGPGYALYGADGEVRWRGVRLGGEVARSDDDTVGDDGAYKVSAGFSDAASRLDVYLRGVGENFSNPSFRGTDSELASLKAGFDGRLGLSPGLAVNAEGYTHELQLSDERRETARTTIDYRRRLLELSAGLRYARHAQPGATSSPPTDDDARGVLALAGIAVGSRVTTGIATSLEQRVAGDVVDDYPNRLKTTLGVPLSQRFRAIATHEYLTASGVQTTHQVTAGVEGTTPNGMQAYSRYSMDRLAGDARMGAVSGIRQKLRLGPRTGATVGVEGFASLSGREDDEYVSLTTGFGSRKARGYFVDGGYEYRWERHGNKNLLRVSAAQQLDGGFAWLTKNILSLTNYDMRRDGTQYYATLAGAYRSPHAPVQSLAMIKSYYDRYMPVDPDAIRWRLVTSIDVNALPGVRHEVRLKYAFKHVEDWSYAVSKTTNTDLLLGQYVWRFARGWDLDTWGRAVITRGGGSVEYGAGVEVGRLFFRSVRVGAGYSINGFEDADVLGTDAWSRGFGVRIQMLLSDWLLADFERLR